MTPPLPIKTANARPPGGSVTAVFDVAIGLSHPVASFAMAPSSLPPALPRVRTPSHYLFEEGCSGTTCNGWKGPHETMAKNVKDWVLTGMIYASPGSTNGTFASIGNDGTNYHTATPITNGPTVDESINW